MVGKIYIFHNSGFISYYFPTKADLFEAGKADVNGLHFLAVQVTPDAERPDGVWLLSADA